MAPTSVSTRELSLLQLPQVLTFCAAYVQMGNQKHQHYPSGIERVADTTQTSHRNAKAEQKHPQARYVNSTFMLAKAKPYFHTSAMLMN